MTVKLMTSDQINNELNVINRMWSGGIPPEQADRINAYKAELKRRGVETKAAPPQPTQQTANQAVSEMSDEQLTKELGETLQHVGRDLGDDNTQERFADLRFEIRKRNKNGNGSPVIGSNATTTETSLAQQLAHLGGEVAGRSEEIFSDALARRVEARNQASRKYHLSVLAANAATNLLSTSNNVNDISGDDIEQACAVGVKIAENICAKVGL